LAVQYGSARETSQGMGNGVRGIGYRVSGELDELCAGERASLPCSDDGQSSDGPAVRPPQS
jgi:hypothetical protein